MAFGAPENEQEVRPTVIAISTLDTLCATFLSKRRVAGNRLVSYHRCRVSEPQRPHKHEDLTFWFQGPIQGGYQNSCLVGSLCSDYKIPDYEYSTGIYHLLKVESRKLEHDRPLIPNPTKKEHQHKSSYIHVATFWSLLYVYVGGS